MFVKGQRSFFEFDSFAYSLYEMANSFNPSVPKRLIDASPTHTRKRGRPSHTPLLTTSFRRILPRPSGSNERGPEHRPCSTSRPVLQPTAHNGLLDFNSREVLINDFNKRKAAASSFPPSLTDISTREAVRRFQTHVETVVADTTNFCASCGQFISHAFVNMLHKTDLVFRKAVLSKTVVEADLDCWFYFCKACFGMILQSKIPKFGSVNAVSMSACQSYPMILKDLTSVEEAVFARAHPVISIMKLRPSGASRFISYQRIRGHAVVLPQNPGPLLDILPSSSLVLHDVIRIVWASKRPHTVEDIRPFARIRRDKVLQALLWLKDQKPLYKNIVINHGLLENWEDEFVPAGIADRVLQCGSDFAEREGYTMNLESDNYENDLHHAVEDAGLDDSGILSGCLYTDADDTREHPTMKLVAAMTNHKRAEDRLVRLIHQSLPTKAKAIRFPCMNGIIQTSLQLPFQRFFPLPSVVISSRRMSLDRQGCRFRLGQNGPYVIIRDGTLICISMEFS